jgi:thioredoxin reductase (NADPH)
MRYISYLYQFCIVFGFVWSACRSYRWNSFTFFGKLLVPLPHSSSSSSSVLHAANASQATIVHDVVIIGSGPAGCTAAIYAGRALLKPVVIAGYNIGGQLMLTSDVENFPGYRQAISGPDLMDDLITQVKEFGADFRQVNCDSIDTSTYPYELTLSNKEKIRSRSIIVSTGAEAVWLNAEDEAIYRGKGISTCATCDGYLFCNKTVVVIGGGDSAMEEALFLTRFASSVKIIHRRNVFKASKLMYTRACNHPKIEFLTDYKVKRWIGSGDILSGAILENTVDNSLLNVSFTVW